MAKPKAQIMAERRAEQAAKGLERVEVFIPPACRERLTKYVESYLSGEVPPKRKRTRKAEHQLTLKLKP